MELDPLREIFCQMNARYLTVRPHGFEVTEERKPLESIVCHVLGHGGARTLYRGRRPVCRSLDGLRAVSDPDKRCTPCPDRKHCTPQVRVDLVFESRPYRLLLAYSTPAVRPRAGGADGRVVGPFGSQPTVPRRTAGGRRSGFASRAFAPVGPSRGG